MADRMLIFIAIRPDSGQVLLVQADDGWSLAVYDEAVPENVGFEDPGPFNGWFRERYGVEVVRRYAVDQHAASSAVFVVECRGAGSGPPTRTLWVGASDIAATSFSLPSHQSILEAWFEGSCVSRTMPWSRAGGYGEAIDWMSERLNDRGVRIAGPLEQVKNAYVSTVFRCPTDHGDVYLKILPSIFVRELEVTRELIGWRIAALPRWIASDEKRGFILMEDMGGRDLTDCCDVDRLEAVMRRFAESQVASVPLLNVERPGPFYDWRLPVLARRIDWAVEEAPALLRGTEYEPTSEEMARLRSRLPAWKELCLSIQAAGIPDALDHGDLRPGNVRIVDEQVIFYDWAWSAITHPFLGPTAFLHSIRHSLPRGHNVRERLRDAYLETWREHGTIEQLGQVFDLVTKAMIPYGVVADAEWLYAIQSALDWATPSPLSADAWTLDRRQYYFAKMLRRLL